MKILIVRNYPIFTDVRKITYNIQELGLAKALVRNGHVCDILFWTKDTEEEVVVDIGDCQSIKVYYRKGKTILKNTVFINSGILFDCYDIIQTCEYNQLESWLLAKKYKNKLLVYHGPYYSKFNKKYNLMCKLFDLVGLHRYKKLETKFLVKSNYAKEFLIKKGIELRNIIVTGVGLDTELLMKHNINLQGTIHREIKKDKSELKLLYIGKIEERRNVKFIIDVLKAVIKLNPNTRLYMVGFGEESYVREVFDYSKKVGVNDKIVWEEKIEQKYLSEIYAYADFFLFPTRYEIFGMVLLEAMFFGNVVISTSNGGADMLIIHSKNGIIIDTNNELNWAKNIIRIYSDEIMYNEIRKNAQEVVCNHYTWDKLVSKFIDAYENRLMTNSKVRQK